MVFGMSKAEKERAAKELADKIPLEVLVKALEPKLKEVAQEAAGGRYAEAVAQAVAEFVKTPEFENVYTEAVKAAVAEHLKTAPQLKEDDIIILYQKDFPKYTEKHPVFGPVVTLTIKEHKSINGDGAVTAEAALQTAYVRLKEKAASRNCKIVEIVKEETTPYHSVGADNYAAAFLLANLYIPDN
ncbi:MAG: hypothetical protein V1725_03315 [archaeon]